MSTELAAAIEQTRATLRDLEDQARAAEREARAAEAAQRHAAAFASIAEQVGGDPEKVGTFLAEVADRSGFDVDYLVGVITGTNHTWE
jgi:hypothetical protein